MKLLALCSIAACFGSLALYFSWRYVLHRRSPSLLCAAMPLGWVTYAVRGLSGGPTDELVVFAALALGLWGVTIVAVHEANQPYPFR